MHRIQLGLLALSLLACGDKVSGDDTAPIGDTAQEACEGDEGTLTVTIRGTSERIDVAGARAFVEMSTGEELEGVADATGEVVFGLVAGDYRVRAEGAPGDVSAGSESVRAQVVACEDTAVAIEIWELDG